MLRPCVSLRAPFQWPFGEDEDEEEPGDIRQLVEWEIVLSTSQVHGALRELEGSEGWTAAQATLLNDVTGLLRDTLDLMRALGGADDKSDLSYVSQPSISEHPQNSSFRDWTALIDLSRDAWLATVGESREQACRMAEVWSQTRYPVFRRLTLFAAAQHGVVPHSQGLEWLLADDDWWLWSVETQRESMRLLVALAPQLDEHELARLERAILAGPPRDMYRADIEDERWERIQESNVWVRLAKVDQGGARLSDASQERLGALSAKYPEWRLAENERDEFPAWSGDAGELRIHVTTPGDRDELVDWLRENPEPDHWRPDDWHERCRNDFDGTASALILLAAEGTWLTARWREALQRWSEDELRERSWREMARVLADAPDEVLKKLEHGLSWWLEKLSGTFEGQEGTFLSLCDRVLALDYDVEDENDDIVGRAINHPVGHVTEGLLQWWYRGDLEDEQRLANEPRRRFSQLCETETVKFRHGRVLLAAHVISLFRVDREWTAQFMLPLFEWENSEAEARSAWEGFLWSPRLHRPLMEVLKPAFLDTANHYARLGRHREQYASLLTFIGLDPGDLFRTAELALAMDALPQRALDHAADTFFRAVDSAGDRRAEYWKNRAAPFLRSIWPKTPNVMSMTVSESFGRACIATGEAFPDALGQVSLWLRPLQFPDRMARALHKAGQDDRFPERALELLHRIVPDDARGLFRDLLDCLNAIRASQPELEHDHRFQRLSEILRANGVGLN